MAYDPAQGSATESDRPPDDQPPRAGAEVSEGDAEPHISVAPAHDEASEAASTVVDAPPEHTAPPSIGPKHPDFEGNTDPDRPPPVTLQTQPAVHGLAMKARNIFAVWIGLPLITLGIYHLVWYYKIHKEMAEFDPRRQIPVAGPMLVLLFLGWTVIAPAISYHNAGLRVRNAQAAAGLPQTCSPAASWLLMFVFGLNSLYLQTELNKVVTRYPGAPPGTPVALVV